MSVSPPSKSLLPQQFYWDTSVQPGRIWAGVPLTEDPNGLDLVLDTGAAVAAMTGTAPPGNVPAPLWWDSNSGQLFVRYDDGSSVQWVSANSIDASMLEGSFLPLTGGVVSGSVTIGADKPNYITMAGGASGQQARITTTGPVGDLEISPQINGRFYQSMWRQFPSPTDMADLARWDYLMTGTTRAGQQNAAEYHAVNEDDVNATANGGLSYFSFGGGVKTGATGGRTAFGGSFTQSGNTVCESGQYYVAGAFWATAYGNAGGAAGAHKGSLFAVNDSVRLAPGADYWESIAGYELDVAADAGTHVNYKHGMSVVFWDSDRVSGIGGKDYAYGISAMGTVCSGWDVGFSFGSPYGTWAMKPTGTMIGTIAGATGGPAWQAAWGIDFSQVTFSGGFLKGNGGINLGSNAASAATDMSKHITLYDGGFGFSVTAGSLNYVSPGSHVFYSGSTLVALVTATSLKLQTVGLILPGVVGTGPSDFSKQIDLYGGQAGISVTSDTSINYVGFDTHTFFAAATPVAWVTPRNVTSATLMQVGGLSGPTWTSGGAVPTSTQPTGSLYSRTGSPTAGQRLYVSAGAGAWTAVAGV